MRGNRGGFHFTRTRCRYRFAGLAPPQKTRSELSSSRNIVDWRSIRALPNCRLRGLHGSSSAGTPWQHPLSRAQDKCRTRESRVLSTRGCLMSSPCTSSQRALIDHGARLHT
ncbi:hypothetical protein M3J09_012563 [Ascochyta lentis]